MNGSKLKEAMEAVQIREEMKEEIISKCPQSDEGKTA